MPAVRQKLHLSSCADFRDRLCYEEDGLDGLMDRRLGKASFRRVPVDKIAWMLGQYRTHHMGWNVKHFHEHLQRRHHFRWGYTWTKLQLQAAGLVDRSGRRGPHRRKRPRKPCVGMMLHQDASPFAWLEGAPDLDLVVTMDDATSEIYSAFLVEEEGVVSTLRGLLEVFAAKGLPSSLYTDRGSHYFFTPAAGEPVEAGCRPRGDGSADATVLIVSALADNHATDELIAVAHGRNHWCGKRDVRKRWETWTTTRSSSARTIYEVAQYALH